MYYFKITVTIVGRYSGKTLFCSLEVCNKEVCNKLCNYAYFDTLDTIKHRNSKINYIVRQRYVAIIKAESHQSKLALGIYSGPVSAGNYEIML